MSTVTGLAIVCSTFHLYQLLTNSALRKALYNHSIIVLNIITLTALIFDVPLYISTLRVGYVPVPTPTFCLYWWNLDEFCSQITIMVVTVACLQRHILIFHERWLSTIKKRILLHYTPIVLAVIYPILFNVFGQLIGSWCTVPIYDYTQPWCQYSPCFVNNTYLRAYNMFFNWVFASMLGSLSDIVLIGRVIWHRRIRLRQPIVWRKHRKMAIQLLLVSLFCSSFNSPMLTYNALRFFKLISATTYNTGMEIYFVFYFSTLLLPFVMIISLPKEYWYEKWRTKLVGMRNSRRQTVPTDVVISY